MYILETHAKNNQEAIQRSASYLGVTPEEIEVRLFKKGGGGFLGLGSKEPSIYHVYPIAGKTSEETVIKGTLLTILHKMGYQAVVTKIERTPDDKMYVALESPDAAHIIGKHGKTMETIQFITNTLVEKFTGKQPKILLDLAHYRKRRAQYLANLARRVADRVIRMGRKRYISPLNPFERRIVHMELQDDKRVFTESEGSGLYKKIWIIPTKFKKEITQEKEAIGEASQEINEKGQEVSEPEKLPPEMYDSEKSTQPDPPQPLTNDSVYP